MSEGDITNPQASERKTAAVGGSNVANLVKRISTELQSKAEVPVRAGAGDVKQRRVKAAFSYTPQNDDELRLEVDDVIELMGEEEEGWWKGRLKGRTGVFPANFVKPYEPSPSPWPEGRQHESGDEKPKLEELPVEGPNPSSSSSGEIQPKKVAGIGFGNIFAGNQKIELRGVKPIGGGGPVMSVIGDSAAKKAAENTASNGNLQKASASSTKKPLPNQAPSLTDSASSQKPKEYAKALFAYDAENEDELNLQEGDMILILSKEVEDAGWWLGEVNGKRGVFPDNFVAQISIEEAEKAKKPVTVPSGASSVPPTVPAKPPKPATTAASALFPDAGKMTPSIPMSESKQTVPKYSIENHSKAETHNAAAEKGASGASSAEKDKSGVYRKPLVPLVGMARSKPFNSGRLFADSGANSPNSDEVDGESDRVNASDADKLSHPTASRARNPNRRPPSQAFLKDMAIDPPVVASAVSAVTTDSPRLPRNNSASSTGFEIVNNNGKYPPDPSHDDYVHREEFDKLQAAFESFKRETRERIREMEKLLSAQSAAKPHK